MASEILVTRMWDLPHSAAPGPWPKVFQKIGRVRLRRKVEPGCWPTGVLPPAPLAPDTSRPPAAVPTQPGKPLGTRKTQGQGRRRRVQTTAQGRAGKAPETSLQRDQPKVEGSRPGGPSANHRGCCGRLSSPAARTRVAQGLRDLLTDASGLLYLSSSAEGRSPGR